MSSNKTLLVAKREFFEILRTKTFWIGVLSFPLIFGLSFAIPSYLSKRQSIRDYVVVDRSGWLLQEVEERATLPDLEKVFEMALRESRKDSEKFQSLPEALRKTTAGLDQAVGFVAGSIEGLDEDEAAAKRRDAEDQIVEGIARAMSGLSGPEGARLREMLPPAIFDQLVAQRDAIRDWWSALPAEEAREYGQGLSKSRYRRVQVDGEGEALIERLNQMVADEELFAYFVVPADPVDEAVGARYVSSNLTDDDLKKWFTNLATDVVQQRRLAEREIDPAVASWVQRSLDFEASKVGASGAVEEVETTDRVRQFAPMAFVYLLWITIFSSAQMLMTNTIEEKSNRIMEVLLSSVSPLQLMMGKILGIAATGLTLMGSWVIFFFLGIKFLPRLMGTSLDFNLDAIARDPLYIASFVVYYILGYFFYAGLLVAIGSVCNSLKEAQNLMQPVLLVLMVPFFTIIFISRDPNGPLAKIMSYIPTFTPFVMMNRAAGPPTTFEYVATTLLLIVSIAVVFWGAAKIFRIGVLMTVKAPTVGEIYRWLRAPVGQVPERQG